MSSIVVLLMPNCSKQRYAAAMILSRADVFLAEIDFRACARVSIASHIDGSKLTGGLTRLRLECRLRLLQRASAKRLVVCFHFRFEQ